MEANRSSPGVLSDLHSFGGRRLGLLLTCCILSAFSAMGVRTLSADEKPSQGDETGPPPAASDRSASAGKLVICGGGKLPDQLGRRFIELAGGTAAKLVVITTASVLADTDRVETKLTFWRRQTVDNLTILHTRSRDQADDPTFTEPLTKATGVWFIGGNQNWLTETYLGTATEKEIRGVLVRGGVVGGTSAGAAIMSPIMIRRDKPNLESGPGFGFLPGTVVDQHFLKRNRQDRLLRVLDSHPNLVGLGIDEGTALVVEGARMSVLGESQVVVCSPKVLDQPPQVRPLEAGAEEDLTNLLSEASARRSSKDPAPGPSHGDAENSDGDDSISESAVSVNAEASADRSEPMEQKLGQ